jgi:hypothetical protein
VRGDAIWRGDEETHETRRAARPGAKVIATRWMRAAEFH